MSGPAWPSNFFEKLGRPFTGEEAFDQISDIVFFVKDREARYVAVNQTLVNRCGRKSKSDLLGLTARDLFPSPLGERFSEQDVEVIRRGRSIHGQLELHLHPSGEQGWCLTWKEPVIDGSGKICGVTGISRDLSSTTEVQRDMASLAVVLDHVRDHLDEPFLLTDLATMANLSTYQLDQRIRALFGVSAGQYVTRCRIESACHLLAHTDRPLNFVALDCGYGDQSAFTRQFRQSVGLTPKAYRERMSPK